MLGNVPSCLRRKPDTPAEFAAIIRTDTARRGKVIMAIGVKAE